MKRIAIVTFAASVFLQSGPSMAQTTMTVDTTSMKSAPLSGAPTPEQSESLPDGSTQPAAPSEPTRTPPASVEASQSHTPQRSGFTIGFAGDIGYGGFAISDPFYVIRTKTTYSPSPVPTTTTVTALRPVTAKGNGPIIGFDCRLGRMFNPRAAILLDFLLHGTIWPDRPMTDSGSTLPGIQKKETKTIDGSIVSTGQIGLSGQFFLTERLWTMLGIGGTLAAFQGPTVAVADDTPPNDNSISGGGFGILGGIGYEIAYFSDSKRIRAISVESRVHGTVAGQSKVWGITIGLGCQWY
jgi:hypothetical protein